MQDTYLFRRAISPDDAIQLRTLFTQVFQPEPVGILAEIMFHHLPDLQSRYWFIAEERQTGRIVSAFVLIPWVWQMEGLQLKVAEMGIVGTLAEHRGQGLMRVLNKEFDQTLAEEGFTLAVIQGIPGFYHQFGYAYAVPLENHINLPLHLIPEPAHQPADTFRLAGQADIPVLMQADASYRASYALTCYRDEQHWQYLLTESQKTEYGSEYWIIENTGRSEADYCRIPAEGFGSGLILSEISEHISLTALESLFSFCKQKAIERDKPYLRLNLPNDSPAGKMAIALGAKTGRPYAWQIKIPDPVRLLRQLSPLLEQRLRDSCCAGYSGILRLDFFKHSVDLIWQQGKLENVRAGHGESQETFALSADLLPALCLGHRSWQELQHIRPDIFPGSARSALLIETLFPPLRAWIHEQY